VTDNAYDKLFKRYTPEQLNRAKVGYEIANEFIRRFVEAGGILKEGSDPPRGMAALLMHEALVMDVEAGVSPMTAIQAATLDVARIFRKDKDYGSVEPGKVADLSIVEGDPLHDIWATQNVKMVVMDGKVVDIGFTRYKNPIPSFYSYQTLPLDLEIAPMFLVEGSGPTVMNVRGAGGMWPFHRVMLNGEPLPTSFVSKDELRATIPPEAIPRAARTLSRSNARVNLSRNPTGPISWWGIGRREMDTFKSFKPFNRCAPFKSLTPAPKFPPPRRHREAREDLAACAARWRP
jgi:hypothetical protein